MQEINRDREREMPHLIKKSSSLDEDRIKRMQMQEQEAGEVSLEKQENCVGSEYRAAGGMFLHPRLVKCVVCFNSKFPVKD